MKKVLISVYDKVANVYSAPMVEPNIEVAKRNFRFGVRQNQVIMSNPGDFELVLIGTFQDDADGSPIFLPSADIRIPVSEILGIRPDTFVEDLKNE